MSSTKEGDLVDIVRFMVKNRSDLFYGKLIREGKVEDVAMSTTSACKQHILREEFRNRNCKVKVVLLSDRKEFYVDMSGVVTPRSWFVDSPYSHLRCMAVFPYVFLFY